MKTKARLLLIAALTVAITAQTLAQQKAINPKTSSIETRIVEFEKQLDRIRQELKIPALSAAIVKDQKVIWARGFGYADVEKKIPATEHTAYHLASLTKTFASTIVMKLMEEGKVKLDDPASKYGIALESEGVIRVRHIFSHTSEGVPGDRYRYSGNRFAELDKVIQKVTGKSYAELLIANILEPLGMSETAPTAPTVVKAKSASEADARLEGEAKGAVTALYAAMSSGNVDQLLQYLSPEHTVFDNDGAAYLRPFTDPEQARRDAAAGVKVNLEAHSLEAAVHGDTAITTCITTGKVTFPGGSRDLGPWRSSYIWNKREGAWKMIHAHLSKIEGSLVADKQRQRFEQVSKIMAEPYELDRSNQVVKGRYPRHFSTSAGLISSVLDMAKYDIAIDQNRFLKKETQQLAFTPAQSNKGEPLPYGLGWFTQDYKGTKFIWHYGYWQSNSSIILKVPERNITFIAMANTDNLSRPTDLGAGDVTSSPVGLAFLKTFIFPEKFGEPFAELDWGAPAESLKEQFKTAVTKPYGDLYKKEMLVRSRMYASVGKSDESARLFRVYADLYSKGLPDDLSKQKPLAEISRVEDDQEKQVEFDLQREQQVRVFAIGEGLNGQMYDYGWIEDAATGKAVWTMKESETVAAGGTARNRRTDTVITLPAGRYRLRYKSDDSHSFDRWNTFPPEIYFWGIALFAKSN